MNRIIPHFCELKKSNWLTLSFLFKIRQNSSFDMNKALFGFILCVLQVVSGFAQLDSSKKMKNQFPDVYKINYKYEVPVTVVGAGITLYNFSRISDKQNSTEAEIENLDKNNIPWFDRWTVHVYSNSMDQASYIPF